MNISLEGKVAVITGGTKGIGLAAAQRFAKDGAAVFILGRQQAELNRAVGEIDGEVYGVCGDVSNIADLDRLYTEVTQKKGHLDIVVANPAVSTMQLLADITDEELNRQLAVNFKGVIFTVQKALPLLRDGGSIILTPSVGAKKGIPMQTVYHGCKAALRSFARTWMVELQERRIRVNLLPVIYGIIQDALSPSCIFNGRILAKPALIQGTSCPPRGRRHDPQRGPNRGPVREISYSG